MVACKSILRSHMRKCVCLYTVGVLRLSIEEFQLKDVYITKCVFLSRTTTGLRSLPSEMSGRYTGGFLT